MNFPLVGNERVKNAVANMLLRDRLPHAVLIEGNSGYGKTTLANYICQAAVCEDTSRPCGKCDSCRIFKTRNHPDVTFISPEKDRKTISVNQVRSIISDASILPQKSTKKVFVIDPADTMTKEAQNALLKVLEEPPQFVVFILTAVSRATMLTTVLSRCTLFTLSSPEESAAEEYISSIIKGERSQIAEAYKKAHGSIGGAINLLRKKSATKVSDSVNEFTELCKTANRYELLKWLLPLEKDRAKTSDFYNELEIKMVSDMLSCSSPTLIKRYDRIYGIITEHKKLLKSNVNLSLLLSSLAVEITER